MKSDAIIRERIKNWESGTFNSLGYTEDYKQSAIAALEWVLENDEEEGEE